MIMISYPIMVTPEVEVSDIKAVYIDNGKQPWMNKSKVSNINHYIEDGKLTNISHRDKNAADTIWLKTYSLESIMIKLKGIRYQINKGGNYGQINQASIYTRCLWNC